VGGAFLHPHNDGAARLPPCIGHSLEPCALRDPMNTPCELTASLMACRLVRYSSPAVVEGDKAIKQSRPLVT
jgi:hypothetical protein